MSQVLVGLSEDEIRNNAITLAKKLFNIAKAPIDVIISDFNIILRYDETTSEGMIPHGEFDIFYSLNQTGEIAVINIIDPMLLKQGIKEDSLVI